MQNSSGQAYGLTVLSPIRSGPDEGRSHAEHVRAVLASFDGAADSPLAKVESTHMARLAVLDDVFYQSYPAASDQLASKYLFFSTNFDGELDNYLEQLRTRIPEDVDHIWRHCVGFPGTGDGAAFRDYFKRCQVGNAIFFADYPDATVQDVLQALDLQRAFIDFVADHQQASPAELKRAFDEFLQAAATRPTPEPGTL